MSKSTGKAKASRTPLLSIKNFNKYFAQLTSLFAFSAMLFISTALYMVFNFVPDDYLQKELVKIMHVHVPAAWLSLFIYTLIALCGIGYLVFRNTFMDIAGKSLAPVGTYMTLIAILTGAIWGKPTWGTWWVWDARLTSMLMLFFIYVGYQVLRTSFDNEERSAKTSAIFAVIGLINIPIIKFSVEIWNTLHQPGSVIRLDGPKIHPSMLYPMLIMFCGIMFFCFFIAFIRMRAEIFSRKSEAQYLRMLS